MLIVAGAASCSSDEPKAAPSKRPCALVQADELSDLLDTEMTLRAATKGVAGCRYTSKGGVFEVRLDERGPVEAGQLGLELTEPEVEKGIGDEAFSSTVNVPLDIRLSARDGGAAVDVDVMHKGGSSAQTRATARKVAAAAVGSLPKQSVKKSAGPRGKEACAPFVTEAASEAFGGKATGTPSNPPGSCTVTIADQDITLAVTVLMDANATEESLEGLVAAVEPTKVQVGEGAAYWLPTPGGDQNGGQLTFLAGDRLLQVTALGDGLEKGQALTVATAAAEIAAAR